MTRRFFPGRPAQVVPGGRIDITVRAPAVSPPVSPPVEETLTITCDRHPMDYMRSVMVPDSPYMADPCTWSSLFWDTGVTAHCDDEGVYAIAAGDYVVIWSDGLPLTTEDATAVQVFLAAGYPRETFKGLANSSHVDGYMDPAIQIYDLAGAFGWPCWVPYVGD